MIAAGKLSPHFSLDELCVTQTGLPNQPSAMVVSRLKLLCDMVLEPVRKNFGRPVVVNSGYRSEAVNKAVGSKSTSQHRLGEAADIEVPGVSNAEVAAWIAANLRFDQLILENYRPGVAGSGWVHVSWSATRRRMQMLTMTMGSHGPVYSAGLP